MVFISGRILGLYERLEEGTGRRAWRMSEKAEVRSWLEERVKQTSVLGS